MVKKIELQMKDRTFSGKDPMFVSAILQKLKSTCDAYLMDEGAAMWLFK